MSWRVRLDEALHALEMGAKLAAERVETDLADRLDVTREDGRHLAFGHGGHFCLGAQLSRLETALARDAPLRRFPDLRFGEAPIVWGDNTVLRGPTRLPLLL